MIPPRPRRQRIEVVIGFSGPASTICIQVVEGGFGQQVSQPAGKEVDI